MKKFALAAAFFTGASFAVVAPVDAASLNFSFSNVIGNVAGTVTGHIDGLNPDGTSPATAVWIDSYPADLVLSGSYATPLDMLSGTVGLENSFTLSGGNYVVGHFSRNRGNNEQLFLNSLSPSTLGTDFLTIGSNNTRYVWAEANVTFTPRTVPEPATLTALVIGVIGLGFARRPR